MPVLEKVDERDVHDATVTETVNSRVVDSSNVEWVGWPVSGHPLMLVQYRHGGLYGYVGVSRQRAVAAAYAKSTGEFINKRIKPRFKVVKIS